MEDKNTFYTCPYCKEEYSAPADLAHCILSCEEKKKIEEEKKKEERLATEKCVRKKEVDEAISNCRTLIKAYMHDYGIYSFTSANDDEIFSSKFWNWIW